MNHPDQLMKVENLGSNKTFHINQVVDVFAQNYSYFTELKYIAFVVPLSSTVCKKPSCGRFLHNLTLSSGHDIG